jgi:hypothetical protein
MVHPATQDSEAGDCKFEASRDKVSETLFQKQNTYWEVQTPISSPSPPKKPKTDLSKSTN